MHEQAQHYPDSADNLEQWFDRVTRDFTSAQYGRTEGSFWFMPSFPTATGSGSALSFIVIGGILGGVVGLLVCFGIYNSSSSRLHGFVVFKIVTLLAAGGAWLGRLVHQGVAQAIVSAPASEKKQPSKRMIYCCRCNQKLLIPSDAHNITVTCQKCNTRFDVD